jgi:chromosome segregation ATPase
VSEEAVREVQDVADRNEQMEQRLAAHRSELISRHRDLSDWIASRRQHADHEHQDLSAASNARREAKMEMRSVDRRMSTVHDAIERLQHDMAVAESPDEMSDLHRKMLMAQRDLDILREHRSLLLARTADADAQAHRARRSAQQEHDLQAHESELRRLEDEINELERLLGGGPSTARGSL